MAYGDDAPLGRGFQILGEQRWGGHAERVVVPVRNLVARPAGRSWEECAAYPLATLTAWRMLKRARLAAGERCLIVGIGGGVSTAALHLAVRMGAEVHVTSRDAAKRDAALELGAVAAYDSGAGLAGAGRGGRRERGPGHLGAIDPGARRRAAAWSCAAARRARRWSSTCRASSSSRSR